MPNLATSLPSFTITPPFNVLEAAASSSTITVGSGRRLARTARQTIASVVDTPAHLLDPSHLPQVDGGEDEEEGEEEVKEEKKEEEEFIGPKPPTFNELALHPSGCRVCGEEMHWVKTTLVHQIYWDHLFVCNNNCEPILLQTD